MKSATFSGSYFCDMNSYTSDDYSDSTFLDVKAWYIVNVAKQRI